jgi:hypothetical protein
MTLDQLALLKRLKALQLADVDDRTAILETVGGGCGRHLGGMKICSGGPGDIVYRLV